MVAPGWTKRSPPSGSTRPAAILSSVDLPEPLRPTRQMRSEGATVSSALSSRGVPPNVRLMFLRVINGGAMGTLLAAEGSRINCNLAAPLARSTAAADFAAGGPISARLAFAEEVLVGHDRLAWVRLSPVGNIGVIIRDTDHEPSCPGHRDGKSHDRRCHGFA